MNCPISFVADSVPLPISTIRLRGPWTPSTRSSSMSEVADGPETSVIGACCVGDRGRDRGERLGDLADDLLGVDHADVVVGHQRQRAAPLSGPPSSTIVPVSAIAAAQPVSAPSTLVELGRARRCRRRARSHSGGQPRVGQTDRDRQPRAAACSAHACAIASAERGRRDAFDVGAVVADPLGEQRHQLVARALVMLGR